jgi:hypothetical protein
VLRQPDLGPGDLDPGLGDDPVGLPRPLPRLGQLGLGQLQPGLGQPQDRLVLRRVQPGQQVAGLDPLALLDQQLDDLAGDLGADGHL